MTSDASAELPSYPKPRGRCPFDPPADYELWREAGGLTKVTLWDGKEAWVATRLDYFRQILQDNRFSVVWSHPGMPSISEATSAPTPTRSSLLRLDDPEHARLRRMVGRDFTAPRVEAMRPHIQQVCDDLVDAIESHGPPVDLVPAYSQALPSLIACEILGVPYEDQEFFAAHTQKMMSAIGRREEALAAGEILSTYLTELIHKKKGNSGQDTFSRLVNNQLANGDITEHECLIMAVLLLVAGHETTANMIAMGTLVLFEHPDQLAMFRDSDDPNLVANAVENLLRYMSIIENNLNRVALEDVEVGDYVIRAGEGVILNVPTANRDPRAFEEPAVLDIARAEPEKHIAFGYGVHQCLGQTLARVELQVALRTLLRRLPNLRSTNPLAEVKLKPNPLIVGVTELPVTW